MRYRDTYAKISLKNIEDNVEYIYNKAKKPLIAIIKANAYGHGYKEVSGALKNNPPYRYVCSSYFKRSSRSKRLRCFSGYTRIRSYTFRRIRSSY